MNNYILNISPELKITSIEQCFDIDNLIDNLIDNVTDKMFAKSYLRDYGIYFFDDRRSAVIDINRTYTNYIEELRNDTIILIRDNKLETLLEE